MIRGRRETGLTAIKAFRAALPDDSPVRTYAETVEHFLNYQLSVGTVELVAGRLSPAVDALRIAFENSRTGRAVPVAEATRQATGNRPPAGLGWNP